MGQEALCVVRLGKTSSKGKAHLDSRRLDFHGDFKLSIPLAEVKSAVAEDGKLKVTFADGVAVFDLGSKVETWAHKIRSPKSLIEKLGIKTDSKVSVLGVRDEVFRAQLKAQTRNITEGSPAKDSDAIFLQAEEKEALKTLADLQHSIKRDGAIWVVAPKGKQHIKEGDVLAAGKAALLVDNKVVSFSDTHTAHKFVIPLDRR